MLKLKPKIIVDRDGLVAYTDGSYSSATGNGGWGFVVVQDGKQYETYSGSVRGPTTNNRMELLAILQVLARIADPIDPKKNLLIVTDSQSSIAAIVPTLAKMRQGIDLVRYANRDLVNQIAHTIIKQHRRIEFEWVKGHAGTHWNEVADKLATMERVELDLKTPCAEDG